MGAWQPGHQHQVQIAAGHGLVLDADVGHHPFHRLIQLRFDQLRRHQAHHFGIGPGRPAQLQGATGRFAVVVRLNL